jgi:hypothetical protein
MMNEPRNLVFVTLVVFAVSCDAGPPKEKSADQATAPVYRWGAYDWVDDPPPVERVDFTAVQFDSPIMRDTLLRWEAAAHGMRNDAWHHESWYQTVDTRPPKSHAIIQWWSTAPKRVDAKGSLFRIDIANPDQVHHIRMQCESKKNAMQPESAMMTAYWFPVNGWGVHFFGSMRDIDTGYARLSFMQRDNGRFSNARFNFFPDWGRWEYRTTFDDVNYYFVVALPDKGFDHRAMPVSLIRDQFGRWSSSPEAFRGQALEMLEKLEQTMREEILSDGAISRISVTVTMGGTHGGDPPYDHEQPAERPLTDTERQTVLDAAVAEVAQRREMLEADYAEFYHALVNVFPIHEFAAGGSEPPKGTGVDE